MRLAQMGSCVFWLLLGCVTTPILGHGDETTNIAKLLDYRARHPDGNLGRLPLQPEWVGDITDTDGKIGKLRLEFGGLSKGDVILYRIRNDRYTSSDAPLYIEKLPKPEDLSDVKTVAELESYFGPSKAFTTGWGDPDRMHWTVGWTYFTTAADNQLRYVSVFGSVSRATDAKQVDVDRLRVSHGLLRHADPNSLAERNEYPTAAALFLREEASKAKVRSAFPLPLRKLLEVDDLPDDSDLVHYRKHLNAIRQNPDPKLFEQLASEMHEGTLSMQSHLERILCGLWPPGMPDHPGLIRLEPWQPEQRTIAVRATVAAIPMAKDNRSVAKLAEILLRMNGGGTITVSNHNGTGGERIDVRKNGLTSGSSDRTPTRKETQAELLRMLLGDQK